MQNLNIKLNRKLDLNVVCVYRLMFPDGKMYIGQTINLYRRKIMHRNLKSEDQPILYSAMTRPGNENFELEVLAICDKSRLDELEKFYIEKYKTYDSDHGLNLQTGGQNGKSSEAARKNRSILTTGRAYSKEGMDAVIAACKRKAKHAVQYSLDGQFVKKWDSFLEAAEFYNVKKGSLQGAAYFNRPFVGYMWKSEKRVIK